MHAALAAGELSLFCPTDQPLHRLVLLFSGWWLLGRASHPQLQLPVWPLFGAGGRLLLGRGTAAWLQLGFRGPGCTAMLLVAVLWGVAASFGQARRSSQRSWPGCVVNLAVPLPLLTPARVQAQAKWQPLNGWDLAASTGQQALLANCWLYCWSAV